MLTQGAGMAVAVMEEDTAVFPVGIPVASQAAGD